MAKDSFGNKIKVGHRCIFTTRTTGRYARSSPFAVGNIYSVDEQGVRVMEDGKVNTKPYLVDRHYIVIIGALDFEYKSYRTMKEVVDNIDKKRRKEQSKKKKKGIKQKDFKRFGVYSKTGSQYSAEMYIGHVSINGEELKNCWLPVRKHYIGACNDTLNISNMELSHIRKSFYRSSYTFFGYRQCKCPHKEVEMFVVPKDKAICMLTESNKLLPSDRSHLKLELL